MTKGRSIRMFLVDGTPGGIVTAEIMNWTGHVMFAPRSRLADLIKRDEAKRTGVYFLTGADPEGGYKPLVYVGETDNVGKRLVQHNKDKEFWDQVCVVTSKDQNLTKAHAKYVESRLIAITTEVGRAKLGNGTAPDYNLLPEADTADMEFFIEQIRIVLPVLGQDFLRATPKLLKVADPIETEQPVAASAPVFGLNSKKHDLQAEAQEVDGDFIVFAGSQAQPNWIGSENHSYHGLYQHLVDAGVLAGEGGGPLVFQQDYGFSSPSAAAAVIQGRAANGRTNWLVKGTKDTYADWQEEQIAAVNSEGGEE